MAQELTAYEVPLIAISNQQLNVQLDGQNCTISVYQRGDRLYLDLSVGQTVVRQGAICIPYAPIITGATIFKGQLYMVDTLAPFNNQQPPQYDGLNDRFKLYYVTENTQAIIENAKYEL